VGTHGDARLSPPQRLFRAHSTLNLSLSLSLSNYLSTYTSLYLCLSTYCNICKIRYINYILNTNYRIDQDINNYAYTALNTFCFSTTHFLSLIWSSVYLVAVFYLFFCKSPLAFLIRRTFCTECKNVFDQNLVNWCSILYSI